MENVEGVKLTLEDAVKVIEGISNHPGLTLNKAEHFVVQNAIDLIKENLFIKEDTKKEE